MLVLSIVEQDIKLFMSKLLIEETFDNFLCRDIKITSFTDFIISGVKINQDLVFSENIINENEDNDKDSKSHKDNKDSNNKLENPEDDAETKLVKAEFHEWSTIKPYIFNIIKGTSKPKSMKIVFSAKKELMEEISINASAMFLNLHFEKNSLQITTATSQTTFDLNNSVDKSWEEYAIKFLQTNDIPHIKL